MNLSALKEIRSLVGRHSHRISIALKSRRPLPLSIPRDRRRCCSAFLTAAMLASLLLFAGGQSATASVGADGWTSLVPSPDSRIIYVSDSDGSDSNDGMSPQSPVKTLSKGYSLLRNGFPDWMLLKRGDTFTNQAISTSWSRSGRSLEEPMVFSSYGDSTERPKILSPASSSAIQAVNGSYKHLAFVGLHFEPHNRQSGDTPRAIRWLASLENFLLEDCYVGGYRDNMAFQAYNGSSLKNVRIRRSVVVDAWSTSSHSQGIFAKDVQGLLIEENVFDHNGWNPSISGAHATIYNHNMYLQYGESTDVVVRGNIVARGSATGIQQRTGGLCEGNLLLRNPTNILFGHFQASWPSQAASGIVRNNVVFDAQDINGSPRGFGIWFQKVDGVEAYGNIVARHESGSGNIRAFFADANYHNLTIRDNIVYAWDGGFVLRLMGSPGGSIKIRDNRFQQPNGSDLIRHEVSMGPFQYQANDYFSASSNPFNPGSNLDGWISASGESGATWGTMSPENSCDTGGGTGADLYMYMDCLGYSASFEAFLSEARQQSRMNWRPEFSADAVNSFVRGAYGMPTGGLGVAAE